MTTMHAEATKKALDALSTMTDVQVLRRAAEILETEPIMAVGTFTGKVENSLWELSEHIVDPGTTAGDTDEAAQLIRDALVEEFKAVLDKPCHCLEGAIFEAAGVYSPKANGACLYPVQAAIKERINRGKIGPALIDTFDQVKLQAVVTVNYGPGDGGDENTIERIRERGDYSGLIYSYSDYVLGPMKGDGPAEAARLLRAAADTLEAS